MRRAERGAAALLLMAIVAVITVGAATAALPIIFDASERQQVTQAALAEAARALAGYARARRCVVGSGSVPSHLPCPDTGASEGLAAPSCAPVARGRLPWRTLGIAPLRDADGECLWYERTPAGARVIAPSRALSGQARAASPAAPVCGGHYGEADYLEAAGNDRSLDVGAATLTVPSGC
jgi:type II secretory pathway pseudopilin PulG